MTHSTNGHGRQISSTDPLKMLSGRDPIPLLLATVASVVSANASSVGTFSGVMRVLSEARIAAGHLEAIGKVSATARLLDMTQDSDVITFIERTGAQYLSQQSVEDGVHTFDHASKALDRIAAAARHDGVLHRTAWRHAFIGAMKVVPQLQMIGDRERFRQSIKDVAREVDANEGPIMQAAFASLDKVGDPTERQPAATADAALADSELAKAGDPTEQRA